MHFVITIYYCKISVIQQCVIAYVKNPFKKLRKKSPF